MAKEIERKFLVQPADWQRPAEGKKLVQGYLPTASDVTVRVRIVDETAKMTIKGPTQGIERLEYEYPIPPADAREILENLCVRPWIEKTRYRVTVDQHVWDVDEFHGDNHGLIVAEIELSHENEPFSKPPWAGPEVSSDPRYYNASLTKRPFSQW